MTSLEKYYEKCFVTAQPELTYLLHGTESFLRSQPALQCTARTLTASVWKRQENICTYQRRNNVERHDDRAT